MRGQIQPGGRAVIIGGGYIGLEMAEALQLQGMTVTLVEAMPRLLPTFDSAIGEAVVAHLAKHKVKVVLGLSAAEVVQDGVRLTDGGVIGADLVLAAIGIRPRIDLAAAAGVKIGETGAIAVDEAMRTNTGVYAAGDCAGARHIVSRKAVWYPLGDIANRQGRVAGTNITGGPRRLGLVELSGGERATNILLLG
jgi:CoA-dependent NAD(P)H sulfur oxidoreductase